MQIGLVDPWGPQGSTGPPFMKNEENAISHQKNEFRQNGPLECRLEWWIRGGARGSTGPPFVPGWAVGQAVEVVAVVLAKVEQAARALRVGRLLAVLLARVLVLEHDDNMEQVNRPKTIWTKSTRRRGVVPVRNYGQSQAGKTDAGRATSLAGEDATGLIGC